MQDLFAADGALVAALIPLGVCIVLAVVLSALVSRIGTRLLGDAEDVGSLARTTLVGIIAVGVLLAIGRLVSREETDEGLTDALGGMVRALPGLVIAFVLVIAALLIAAVVRATLTRAVGAVSASVGKIVGSVAYWAIVILVSLIAAEQAGMDVGILRQLLMLLIAGGIGAGALALGLGTRDIVAAVAAGRHVDQILEVGDVVEVGEVRGTVVGIGHAAVQVQTVHHLVEVPNTLFLEEPAAVTRLE